MDDLNTVLAGAGLAGATGHRAFLPAFVLGLAHRIGAADAASGGQAFFQLSQRFEWLGDPKVLTVLGVLALIEFIAERNPDAPELVNLALKAPKAVMGFIVVAGTVGKVDDNFALMAASGLFGSATSLGVDTMRASVKHAVQEPLSDATHGASDKAMGWLETAWSGFLSVMSWVLPIVALLGIGVLVGLWFARRKIEKASRVACEHCGFLRHPQAKVCPGCKKDVTPGAAGTAVVAAAAPVSAPVASATPAATPAASQPAPRPSSPAKPDDWGQV